ncbi:MAG: sarcosine oxidase subunit delta [Alphaproteobacteria bacterium]
MKLMTCPLNGPRNISEFVFGGEVKPMPDPWTVNDREWVDYAIMDNNTAGVVREWWYHVPTAYWFIAERNTVTDEIVRTYKYDEVFKERRDFNRPPAAAESKSGDRS